MEGHFFHLLNKILSKGPSFNKMQKLCTKNNSNREGAYYSQTQKDCTYKFSSKKLDHDRYSYSNRNFAAHFLFFFATLEIELHLGDCSKHQLAKDCLHSGIEVSLINWDIISFFHA